MRIGDSGDRQSLRERIKVSGPFGAAPQDPDRRVMIISPPDLGTASSARPDIPADSTVVLVVDVLGVG